MAQPYMAHDLEQVAGSDGVRIEAAEDDADGSDSAIGSSIAGSIASSTTSLDSSMYESRELHGRKFQGLKTTQYWGPVDDRQDYGLDIAHHFMFALKDGPFLAPVEGPPKSVLDLGTGTGFWAMDMADKYPSANIIGSDISPRQPTYVPVNCMFELEDAQLEWTYKKEHFDFIHLRALYGCIAEWKRLYQQVFDTLQPGGWVEHTEISIYVRSDASDACIDEDHIFRRWAKHLWEAGDKFEKTLRIAEGGTMKKLATNAGLVNVQEKCFRAPIGTWSSEQNMREIGLYNLHFMDESLEGFALFLLEEIMGWQYEEVQLFVMEMRKAIRNKKLRPYYYIRTVYGQRPTL